MLLLAVESKLADKLRTDLLRQLVLCKPVFFEELYSSVKGIGILLANFWTVEEERLLIQNLEIVLFDTNFWATQRNLRLLNTLQDLFVLIRQLMIQIEIADSCMLTRKEKNLVYRKKGLLQKKKKEFKKL